VGVHPVREALRAGRRRLHRLLLREGGELGRRRAELLEEARRTGTPAEEMSREAFARIAGPGVSQGVALEAGALPAVGLAELMGPEAEGPRWILALDGIEDPQNLGALLRVADAAGVAGVVVPERRSAPLSAAVGRASAGALEHVPVARVTNLSRALRGLKDGGFWVYAADPGGGIDLWEARDRLLGGRLVLVLGAEGRGVRRGVLAATDASLRIPMTGRVASLNVATAAAVILFELRRRARATLEEA
jgi:23S rRNA (guanosine2251-2'-O)-methyltransferase